MVNGMILNLLFTIGKCQEKIRTYLENNFLNVQSYFFITKLVHDNYRKKYTGQKKKNPNKPKTETKTIHPLYYLSRGSKR